MAKTTGPVETKVKVAGAVATVVSFVLWLLARYVFDGAVPGPVGDFAAIVVGALLTGLATFWSAWQAKHTPRNDADAVTRR